MWIEQDLNNQNDRLSRLKLFTQRMNLLKTLCPLLLIQLTINSQSVNSIIYVKLHSKSYLPYCNKEDRIVQQTWSTPSLHLFDQRKPLHHQPNTWPNLNNSSIINSIKQRVCFCRRLMNCTNNSNPLICLFSMNTSSTTSLRNVLITVSAM